MTQPLKKPASSAGKLIAIVGPTTSGKSTLAIALAQKLDGEIVSADSRQVYRNLDIGTGKVTKDEQAAVPHHLLDIVEPGDTFSVSEFQLLAFRAIDDILKRNKRPFLVGGTALYAYAVIDNYQFTDVPPNPKRRAELEEKTISELQNILENSPSCNQACPEYSRGKGVGGWLSRSCNGMQPPPNPLLNRGGGMLGPSDFQNPRRLIRAIEKLEAGAPITSDKGPERYDILILGIDVPRAELYKKIDARVDERIKQGMIEEVQRILDVWPKASRSLGEGWLINLGLEYRWITEYLRGKWTRDEMAQRLKGAIHAFARRQMTWFRRDRRIVWVKNAAQAQSEVREFLKKKAA